MKLLILILALAIALTTTVRAQAGAQKYVSAREILRDFEQVRTAPYFIFEATASDEAAFSIELAFRSLLKSPSAAAQCKKLVAGGSPAGQLYGLLGLKILNDPAYASLSERYVASRSYVPVFVSPAASDRPVSMLASEINKGNIK